MQYGLKTHTSLLYVKKILGFDDFLTIGFFPGFPENPRDFRKIPGIRDFFLVSGFLSPGFFIPGIGIFLNFGIFIPGIFAKSPGFMQNPRDFYPGDSGFFRDFLPSGYPGDFLSPGSGFFFVGWDIPTKSHL